jgi:hypothetical protein
MFQWSLRSLFVTCLIAAAAAPVLAQEASGKQQQQTDQQRENRTVILQALASAIEASRLAASIPGDKLQSPTYQPVVNQAQEEFLRSDRTFQENAQKSAARGDRLLYEAARQHAQQLRRFWGSNDQGIARADGWSRPNDEAMADLSILNHALRSAVEGDQVRQLRLESEEVTRIVNERFSRSDKAIAACKQAALREQGSAAQKGQPTIGELRHQAEEIIRILKQPAQR